MSLQGSMTVERMCELGPVSRAGFYRFLQEERPIEEEMEVRSAIQQIAVGHRRRYGYRRIAAELRRRGMRVNHKRVLRIMRKDNLLAVNRRQFVVTTDSNHTVEVYLNLASRMRLTGIDQLEIECDVSMLKRLWRRIVERHRRVSAEPEQIELELAGEESRFPLLPPFPQKPYKASTLTLFCVFGFFVAFAALVCLKELVISFFR